MKSPPVGGRGTCAGYWPAVYRWVAFMSLAAPVTNKRKTFTQSPQLLSSIAPRQLKTRALRWCMSTEKQIDANRRNSQHSTGPRTDAGKSRSRLNALKTGIDANLEVLPKESAESFADLTS